MRTLSSISSAVAVHAIGPQSLFQCSTNDSIALLRAFTELNVPHRISFRVIMPFQISIWFIHDAPVGVKWKTTRPRCLASHSSVSFDRCTEAFALIQSHRTAADRAALIAKCTWRIVKRGSGRHSCGGHSIAVQPALSQSCSG